MSRPRLTSVVVEGLALHVAGVKRQLLQTALLLGWSWAQVRAYRRATVYMGQLVNWYREQALLRRADGAEINTDGRTHDAGGARPGTPTCAPSAGEDTQADPVVAREGALPVEGEV